MYMRELPVSRLQFTVRLRADSQEKGVIVRISARVPIYFEVLHFAEGC